MTTLAIAKGSLRHPLTPVIVALRGIRGAQCRMTAVLGMCLTLVTVAVYFIPLLQLSWTNPWWAIVTDIAIGDQLKAFLLLVAVVIADRAADDGYPSRNAYLLAALVGCTVGVAASETFSWVWRSVVLTGPMPATRPWLHGHASLVFRPLFALTNWLLIGSAAVFLYAGRRAELRTARRLRTAELERIRRARLALESRLQAMQARVEPQFLFNTLVQVERLYEIDATLAARMLDDLIAYLRAAMPLMRDTSSSLAQELDLASAYLDIVRIRLGERLAVTIERPPESADIRMPSMMLLPLIDRAIVRDFPSVYIERAISIRIDTPDHRLRLTLVDSGPDLVAEARSDGLNAIRERLTALYGDRGSLTLTQPDPRSTVAVLEIPLERRAPADPSG